MCVHLLNVLFFVDDVLGIDMSKGYCKDYLCVASASSLSAMSERVPPNGILRGTDVTWWY